MKQGTISQPQFQFDGRVGYTLRCMSVKTTSFTSSKIYWNLWNRINSI